MNEVRPSHDQRPQHTANVLPTTGPRTILSSELLGGAREVQIQHGDETYRLRLTRSGKLLLNK